MLSVVNSAFVVRPTIGLSTKPRSPAPRSAIPATAIHHFARSLLPLASLRTVSFRTGFLLVFGAGRAPRLGRGGGDRPGWLPFAAACSMGVSPDRKADPALSRGARIGGLNTRVCRAVPSLGSGPGI